MLKCDDALFYCCGGLSHQGQNDFEQDEQQSREADKQKRVAEVGNALRGGDGAGLRGGLFRLRGLSGLFGLGCGCLGSSGFVTVEEEWTRVCGGDVGDEEAHADFFRRVDELFFAAFAEADVLTVFVGGLEGRAVGTPVFFSGATNLPRAVFARSGAAAMSSGCGPA